MKIDTDYIRKETKGMDYDSGDMYKISPRGALNLADELDRLYAIEENVKAITDKKNGYPKQFRDAISAILGEQA